MFITCDKTVSLTKTKKFTFVTDYSEYQTKHKNALRLQNAQFLNVKASR